MMPSERWIAYGRTVWEVGAESGTTGNIVCEVKAGGNPTKRHERAKLIAAAPDLEAALHWAVNFLETNYSAADMPELVTLRAALDKVKS
jgi:hypothetical protein